MAVKKKVHFDGPLVTGCTRRLVAAEKDVVYDLDGHIYDCEKCRRRQSPVCKKSDPLVDRVKAFIRRDGDDGYFYATRKECPTEEEEEYPPDKANLVEARLELPYGVEWLPDIFPARPPPPRQPVVPARLRSAIAVRPARADPAARRGHFAKPSRPPSPSRGEKVEKPRTGIKRVFCRTVLDRRPLYRILEIDRMTDAAY